MFFDMNFDGWIKGPFIPRSLITYKNPISLSNEKAIELCSFIACNSTIVSNEQKIRA